MQTTNLQWANDGDQSLDGEDEYEQRFKDASGCSYVVNAPLIARTA